MSGGMNGWIITCMENGWVSGWMGEWMDGEWMIMDVWMEGQIVTWIEDG